MSGCRWCSLGAEQLQRLPPDQLSRFYRALKHAGGQNGKALSSNTVRRVHATVHRAFRDATQWGHLQRNPASLAVKPRRPAIGARDIATWSTAEVRTFLDSVSTDRLFAMWRLAAMTGMRRGELVGLRWSDVNLAANDFRCARPPLASGLEWPSVNPRRSAANAALHSIAITVHALST